MKDNLYNPCPNIPAPDCGCEKPPVCHESPCPTPPPPPHHCNERPCPPPPPPCGPSFPPFCPEDKPHMGKPGFPGCGPMPPVPSVVTGMDLYEAMNRLNDRVNVCIHNYNAVMAEGYKTLHNMQRAAQENGAYYGPGEVWVEEGYYADESSTYHLVHKACVDRRGEPIRMQLHLAYGNTTNSKIEQKMFNASKVEFADKIVVAIPKGEGGWYGKAIWHGCPIQSDDKPELYTVGFTKSGVMRVYNNGADIDQMLRDTVVDAMGCSGVLIQNGQVTDESYRQHIPNADQQTSRVCIGQNLATREVIILTVGNENDVNRKGLTSMACAQILRQYGCDIAVELCEGVGSGAMDKGSLMYVPDDGNEPTAYAYWFISRKCFYKSDYERELAELVQNYGACIWQGFLNKKAIAQVKQELADEIARATEAERVLQENINKETERATAEEQRIEGKVDAETERATEAERVLQENIDRETQRATGEEQRIEGRLNEEIQRATGEEQRIEGKLDAEIQRSTAEDERIDSKLDDEIQRAKDAEKVLTDNLDAEIHRAQDEEAKLHGEIETERGERKAEDLAIRGSLNDVNADLTGKINAESQARIAADTALDTKLSARIDTWEKEVTKLQGLMTTLQNQMTSLDTTVTAMLHTVSDIEVALNNVKTSIADIISGKTILPYVRLAGDTMTGVLNMGGNEITGLPGLQFVNGSHLNEANGKLQAVNGDAGVRVSGADAVDDNDFVTKKQLDSKTIPVFTLNKPITLTPENITIIKQMVELTKNKKPFTLVTVDETGEMAYYMPISHNPETEGDYEYLILSDGSGILGFQFESGAVTSHWYSDAKPDILLRFYLDVTGETPALKLTENSIDLWNRYREEPDVNLRLTADESFVTDLKGVGRVVGFLNTSSSGKGSPVFGVFGPVGDGIDTSPTYLCVTGGSVIMFRGGIFGVSFTGTGFNDVTAKVHNKSANDYRFCASAQVPFSFAITNAISDNVNVYLLSVKNGTEAFITDGTNFKSVPLTYEES